MNLNTPYELPFKLCRRKYEPTTDLTSIFCILTNRGHYSTLSLSFVLWWHYCMFITTDTILTPFHITYVATQYTYTVLINRYFNTLKLYIFCLRSLTWSKTTWHQSKKNTILLYYIRAPNSQPFFWTSQETWKHVLIVWVNALGK